MRRTIFLFLIISIISIFIVNPVLGVGIGKYTNEQNILFQPGLEKTYTFYLYDDSTIHCSIEGDLAEYAVIKDPSPDGGPRNVEVALTLPDYLEPGSHTLYIVATQASSIGEATVGGVASVRTGVNVFALYPGEYPSFDGVYANDLNVNEKTNMVIGLSNEGEDTIADASGIITIYDQNNNTIAILHTNSVSVKPFEKQTLSAELDAAVYNLSVGTYRAVGNLTCDGTNVNHTEETNFIVGTMNVDIVDTTPDVIVNATNKYYINLESDWSGDIDNVYAKITMPDGKVIKSPNVDMIKSTQGSKAQAQIETYMETTDLSPGSYDVDITVYYKGLSRSNKIKLNVIEGKAPIIEKPKLITPMTIFIALGILVILFVAMYFLVFKHSDGNNTTSSHKNIPDNNNNTEIRQPNNDDGIRPPSL
jgi:hypothetical protein